MFSKTWTTKSTKNCFEKIERLQEAVYSADAVLIGAGAGLSTSAGLTYEGERFRQYFSDFEEKYGFHDMYTGGFYPYETLEEHWAYWSRYIYINRYMDAPKPVYHKLLELVQDKDCFVLTTNVDHQFQKARFDRKRLYYTQGDYGLFQCSEPCHQETYENAESIRRMVEAQGYVIDAKGILLLPEGAAPQRTIPSKQIPVCPRCGKPMSMNLRADATFVEDAGWHRAAERYAAFLRRHEKSKIVFLELGVGYNTPGIIKYSFWQMTAANPKAVYACLNDGEAVCPKEIAGKSICIDGDIGEVLQQIRN
ncbi:MAG: Sir2 silent information regulator family NAD-dependent deacetylase [Lachnospiraceae bacterium]